MLRILALITGTVVFASVSPDPIRDHLETTTWDLPPAVYQHPERTTTTTVLPEPVRSVQITAPVVWADERRTPAPTTTLPTVFVNCPGLEPFAEFAGWPRDRWPLLDRIIWAESRCENRDRLSPTGRPIDRGLLQINQIHRDTLAGYGIDWDHLLDPATNLLAGRLVAEQAENYGWNWCEPWYMSGDWSC
jgi:hypothetical protein